MLLVSFILLLALLSLFPVMLYDRGSHHQLFDIIKKGENKAFAVLLYMFLMMSFRLVYYFNNWPMISMLKHPTSMCLCLGFTCVMWKSVIVYLLTLWIDSSHTESIHQNHWLLMNRFTILWIISHSNRIISVWTFSQNSLTCAESNHLKGESYHSSSWAYLNQFTYALNHFILHALLGCPFAVWINSLIWWIHSLCWLLLTIYTILIITHNSLNHFQLFSLGIKNSLHINSSRLNTFS